MRLVHSLISSSLSLSLFSIRLTWLEQTSSPPSKHNHPSVISFLQIEHSPGSCPANQSVSNSIQLRSYSSCPLNLAIHFESNVTEIVASSDILSPDDAKPLGFSVVKELWASDCYAQIIRCRFGINPRRHPSLQTIWRRLWFWLFPLHYAKGFVCFASNSKS